MPQRLGPERRFETPHHLGGENTTFWEPAVLLTTIGTWSSLHVLQVVDACVDLASVSDEDVLAELLRNL